MKTTILVWFTLRKNMVEGVALLFKLIGDSRQKMTKKILNKANGLG